MQKKELKFNKITIFFSYLSKFLIFFIILLELVVLTSLPIFLNKQKLAPLKFEQQKTAFLIEDFKQKLQIRLKDSPKNITHPLILEINNRINKIIWELKNQKFNFSITYLQDIQKNVTSYQKSLALLDKKIDIELQYINQDKLIKSIF